MSFCLETQRAYAARLKDQYEVPTIPIATYEAALNEIERLTPSSGGMPAFDDGSGWAKSFLEAVREDPTVATDYMALTMWFSNALMAGYDKGRQS